MSEQVREADLSPRMSEHEALMWNIEKDPWLNPNGASLTLLDRPVDMERFRNQLRYGVSKMPRLYQRVVPGLGRLSTPAWAPDPEFDFDYHVREIQLPGAGTRRELLDLAARLYAEPMDRTRPLWRFVVISGVEGDKSAIWAQTHHAIADGVGQLRMAELYQQISIDQPAPDPVDLDAIIADAVKTHRAGEAGGDLATSLVSTTQRTAGHLLRRQAGLSRRLLGEVMLWPADVSRVAETADGVTTGVRSAVSMLTKSSGSDRGGSPLWNQRSRHRHLEYVQVPLDGLKAAAKTLGGTINDAFMIGLTEAAVRYHSERGAEVETLNTSFIVSTRTDNKMGGNSFTPVLVQVPGHAAGFATRMEELRSASTEAREASEKGGGISGLSGVVNLLPTSVVTRTARKQAAAIDFATSNLRGAPFPLFCAGAKVEATVCMGPVAGTAANATALSYDGKFDIGLFVDPQAITDPESYRKHVETAFADLLAIAEPTAEKPAKKSTAKKSTPGKSTARTSTAKKSTAKKTTAKKSTAEKTTAKKSTAEKSTAKKPASKKSTAKKITAKRSTANRPAANGSSATNGASPDKIVS